MVLTTEQQNKAWACLPKEARKEIKRKYKIAENDIDLFIQTLILDDIFGHHNLTSYEEPSELLFVERKKVQEVFVEAENSIPHDAKYNVQGALHILFGDKCLPDKEPSVQVEPKFHKGDLVICLTDGQVYEVEGKTGKHHYALKGSCYDAHEDNLEPYTEPQTKEPKLSTLDAKVSTEDTKVSTLEESRSLSQFLINCDKAECQQPKPKFNKGVRVKIVDKEVKTFGDIAIVRCSEVDNGKVFYWLDDDIGCYMESQLEPYTEPIAPTDDTKDEQKNDTMEEKELNLCELLKGCEKEQFYSPMLSDVFIVQLRETSIHIVPCDEGDSERFFFIDKCGVWTKGGQCVLFPSRALYEKYPLDAYSAWMEWKSERTPKRWRNAKITSYWFINFGGQTEEATDVYDKYDNNRYNFGNYFKDEQTAQQAAEAVRECLMKFHEQNKK